VSTVKKILIVDDEPKILEVVSSYLKNSGYDVYDAGNGRQALELFGSVSPHLVILDLMLPDVSGEEICRLLRKVSRVPIIMLTAKIEEEDILKGLDIGADDYVIKPFSPKQLVARVAALLRRTEEYGALYKDILSFNNSDLIIDVNRHLVSKDGYEVNTTPNEYKLLVTMARHPKKAFTRDELISVVIGDDFDGFDRTIDTHIKNLRQKIEKDPKNPQYILTVHGIGYRFGGE
jgi:DNA-binding response OmpR family regulator